MQTTMISWLIGQLICWFICCLIQLILLGHFSITLISNTPIPLTSCNVVYHSVLFKEISNHIPRVPPPPPLWKFQVRGGMDTVWNCTTLLTNLANLRGQGDEICSHKILLNVHVWKCRLVSSWGQFLKSPGNLPGLMSDFGDKRFLT